MVANIRLSLPFPATITTKDTSGLAGDEMLNDSLIYTFFEVLRSQAPGEAPWVFCDPLAMLSQTPASKYNPQLKASDVESSY